MPKQRYRRISLVFYFLVAYIFIFLLKNPGCAAEAVTRALKICYLKLIPSLFPFMVLSSVVTSSKLSVYLSKAFGKAAALLFRTKKEGATALIAGSLFGFPLGTKTALELYKQKALDAKETERIICVCSNTGPAFVLSACSVVSTNNSVGVCIYLCQLVSAMIVSFFVHRKTKQGKTKKTEPYIDNPLPIIPSIPLAITSSVIPMLNVCAFVCFFSCITASVENIIFKLGIPTESAVFLSGFLEITNGIAKTSDIDSSVLSVLFAGFFVGWSGLSVILQSVSLISEYGLKCKKYVISKLFQGLICALLSVFFCKLFNLY